MLSEKKVIYWLLEIKALEIVLTSETAWTVFRRGHKNAVVLHFTLCCSVCWFHLQTMQVGRMAAPAPANMSGGFKSGSEGKPWSPNKPPKETGWL